MGPMVATPIEDHVLRMLALFSFFAHTTTTADSPRAGYHLTPSWAVSTIKNNSLSTSPLYDTAVSHTDYAGKKHAHTPFLFLISYLLLKVAVGGFRQAVGEVDQGRVCTIEVLFALSGVHVALFPPYRPLRGDIRSKRFPSSKCWWSWA